MVSGQNPEEVLTQCFGRVTDNLVDDCASFFPSATEVQANIGKALFRAVGEYVVREGVADANRVKSKPEDMVHSVKFETAGRFIVIRSDKSGKTPSCQT